MGIDRLKAFVISIGFAASSPLLAIECAELERVTDKLLLDHYVHQEYDDALSQRILDRLFIELDPGKLIFTQSDIDEFKARFGDDIDIWLFAQSCGFLEAIQQRYHERTQERQSLVDHWLQTDHDFSIDEHYQHAQFRSYLDSPEELNERWRKQIKYQLLQTRLTGLDETTIHEKLNRFYEDQLAAPDRLEASKLLDHFLKAFARALDPHTKYYPPANEADIRIALGESFFGIGATIESRNESFFISRLNPGGPAFKGKELKAGDQILAVTNNDQAPVETFGKTLTEVVHMIRGPKGTQVDLTVHRQSDSGSVVKKIPIVRDKIDPVAAAATSETYLASYDSSTESPLRIGVISLSSFYLDRAAQRSHQSDYRSASRDVEKRIKALEEMGIDSLILDLRGNGGGVLSEAVEITGLFIESGPVVQKRDAFDDVVVLRDKDRRIVYEGPLTVIIEPGSASASEIVAGALQDYRRALIVGTGNTFGKGTVQIVSPVDRKRPDLGSYKLTNALYFLPSGRTPQLHGISPDVLISSKPVWRRTMASIDFAVSPAELPAIEFPPSSEGDHYRATLQARTQQRLPRMLSPDGPPKPKEIVSLKESTYTSKSNSKDQDSLRSKTQLEEVVRISFDRYRLLNFQPLENRPITVSPLPAEVSTLSESPSEN